MTVTESFTGTLARMTIDGAPRPWMDGVREADWAPDGDRRSPSSR